MPPDDAARRFVENFALVLSEAGMPRMPSRVFACVLASDNGRMTAAEIAEDLEVSAAAVSGAVRYLVPLGMLRKAREPGARVDHYALPRDGWYETIASRDALIRRWESVLDDGVNAMHPDSAAAARLRESRDFFAFLRVELPAMLERWRAQQGSEHGSPE